MNIIKVIGIGFIILGVLALVYRGFNYTKESHDAKIGPLEVTVKDKERVEVPTWAGVGAIVVGGVLLLVKPRRELIA